MISIFSIVKDKSLWMVSLSISILFLIVPYAIFSYSYILLGALTILVLFFLSKKLLGFSCIIFAYGQMLPYGDFQVGTGASSYITYALTLLCATILIFSKRKQYNYDFKLLGKLIPVFVILGVIFTIKNDSFNELKYVIFFIISTIIFFYVCLNDPISLKQFYAVLDVIFYFTAFYVIREKFFHSSPYQNIYDTLIEDFQLRAKGLMGHPLVLSSFLAFYHGALLTRGLILKKWNIINFLLVIVLVILSASKTDILLIIISWVAYIILTKAYKTLAFYIVGGCLVAISLFFLPKIEQLSQVQVDRLKNSSVDNRVGSYNVAFQVIENNFLIGVGLDRKAGLRPELSSGNYLLNKKYDLNFLIFDNAYLTIFSAYGIFGLLILMVYIQPVFIHWRYNKNKELYRYGYAIILVFIIFMAQNFSFDSFYFFPVNSFYFSLMAIFIKEISIRKQQFFIFKTVEE